MFYEQIFEQDETQGEKKLDEKSIFKLNANGRFSCLDPSCVNRKSFGHKNGVLVSSNLIYQVLEY